VKVHSPVKGVDEEVEGMLGELLFTDVMRAYSVREMILPSRGGTPRYSHGSIALSWGSSTRWS
jgi:hypothetical protein